MSQLYFAYGSNLLHAQMKERCPNSIPIERAILRNYKLVFKSNKKGRGVADVVPCSQAKVYGALYELTKEDEKILDGFEGVPNVYVKKYITVETRKGEVKALIYVMLPKFQIELPSHNYFKRIFDGYGDWYLPKDHLCDEYLRLERFVDRTNDGTINLGKTKVKKNRENQKIKNTLDVLEMTAILNGYKVTYNSCSTAASYQFFLPNNTYELSLFRDGKSKKISNVKLFGNDKIIYDANGEDVFIPINELKSILTA